MYKRIISLIVLCSILFAYSGASVLAQTYASAAAGKTKNVKKVSNLNYDNLVPKKLETEMKTSIAHIYGKEQVQG